MKNNDHFTENPKPNTTNRPSREEKIQLSIIVPAYTEKELLRYNVRRVLKDNLEYILEIIIIVSAFADKETLRICKELSEEEEKVTYRIQKNNPGLGRAVREAFNMVRGTHILILFADAEADPKAVPLFINKAIETDADVVVGSRWLERGRVHNYPPIRFIFNRAFQVMFRKLYNTKLHDLTFGFTMLKRDAVKNIIWHGIRQDISTEIVLKPLRLNYHIEEVPVTWRRRTEGKSKLKLISYLYFPLIALFILLVPKKWICYRPQ